MHKDKASVGITRTSPLSALAEQHQPHKQGEIFENNKEMEMQIHVEGGDISLLDSSSGGIYEKSLPCFGCGIGWFSFLLGFVFPPLWYYATVLYFGNYYLKDPRERPGLAASAIAVSKQHKPKYLLSCRVGQIWFFYVSMVLFYFIFTG
ncbi:uncharacterized protein LOC133034913 isoform X1 [Cannabis sativa]|uniref:uncharacterized protein LOC133034913 isoform X1 n=1 Tax=Cannabis sativa TaxID=3483 RepID=UPI0029C9BF2D|nr:uncharacterized protein LOC133034913 isoform X1 [Cannabis sativa]